MNFITVRDLRNKPAQIQQQLAQEKELVLTSNGKAVAILTPVTSETLEETLTALRRSRAIQAVASLQQESETAGVSRLSLSDITKEIAAVRRRRRGRRA
ncbi:MAG: type II toxin-antitoxin system Phd/YefM family antitoxin [Candidatus Omnitrophica bacterium]|nr:type II toxin-antitoxin system Phd/YefM family antitoxin [Candidatus Omnitrophota bacterium]